MLEQLPPDQAVVVQFTGYAEQFFKPGNLDLAPLHKLHLEIDGTLAVEGTGVMDGHDIAVDGSTGTLFLYGPDARALFASVAAILDASPITRGGTAFLYFGDINDEATAVEAMPLGISH